MPTTRLTLLKGTLDLLLLRTLSLEPLHGAAIAERVAQITGGAFEVKAGSLFPGLHRLEQEGWVRGDWTTSPEGRRVKCYALTATGRRHLNRETEAWNRTVAAMSQVLGTTK
jgi:PadR family transcriptional regulator PadR